MSKEVALRELIERLRNNPIQRLDLDVEQILDSLWYAALTYSQPQTDINSPPDRNPEQSPNPPQSQKPLLTTPSLPERVTETPVNQPIPIYPEPTKDQSPPESNPVFLDVPDPPAIPLEWQEEIKTILQPLLRKTPSKKKSRLIEEKATVQAIAETELEEPVFKPLMQRNISLSLIIELGASAIIWKKTREEIEAIFTSIGAFHPLDVHWLKKDEDTGQIILKSRVGNQELTRSPESINYNPTGKKLFIIISDFTSVHWYKGEYIETLENWSKKGFITLLQLFPERLWSRTALDRYSQVQLQSAPMGTNYLPYLFNNQLISTSEAKQALKLPVITLELSSLKEWVNIVSGKKQGTLAGVLMQKFTPIHPELEPSQILEAQEPQKLLERFYNNASPSAENLAHRLAAVPVTLPIIRLIQTSCLQAKTKYLELPAVSVAEVLMGGLFEPLKVDVTSLKAKELDLLEWQFRSGIRESLRKEATEKQIIDTISLVSNYIADSLGKDYDSFRAVLFDRNQKEQLPEEVQRFAEISARTLASLGGIYAKLVESYTVEQGESTESVEIDGQTLEVKSSLIPGDVLQDLQIEVPTLTFQETDELPKLQFTTVFVNSRGERIREEEGEAYYYDEALGEESLRMIYIPAGEFWMGTEEEEIKRLKNNGYSYWADREKPSHLVKVPAFYLSQTPITQGQWKEVVTKVKQVNINLNREPAEFTENPSMNILKGEKAKTRWDRPVEKVSWEEAVEYCQRLTKLTGRAYQLPSESQWEYACRARTTTPFHFGETLTSDLANYYGSQTLANEPKGKYCGETTPVGQFPPNGFGLYDMHGNVWEWCEDDWHSSYAGNPPLDGSAWKSEDWNRQKKILRGGSWDYDPVHCRSAYRNYYYRNGRIDDNGFRVMCWSGREDSVILYSFPLLPFVPFSCRISP
jgi:formylglycine-generating enzyme required for sulfatase activity